MYSFRSCFVAGWVKSSALAKMRHDELIAELLIMRHRAETCARGGVEFFHASDRLDIEQLQAAGLQKPSAVICLVATRPADRRDFGHLAFCG